ncbi:MULTISPECIES: ATP-binding protein [unclassified Streptomyces]|uniref:ATP-binding protein n=1 Tax=unclassified Streptomyces TaxID=2593676 RepID=UPI0022541A32|nr:MULTISPECIES: ATP-binding protein [unclassified Streptomyces]MCX4834213.1 ATP-binding protein [Streptomyces sp. NBC_01016]
MNGKPPLPRRVGRRPVTVCQWTDHTPNVTALARTALRQVLLPLKFGEEQVDDVVLAVSELVANATEHAPGPYALRLRRTSGEYVCEVEDTDLHMPQLPVFPAAAPFGPVPDARGGGIDALLAVLGERGRGLHIVDELTRGAWGFTARGAVKVAWAAFPCPVPRIWSRCP